jgi:YD repeat-containing protein
MTSATNPENGTVTYEYSAHKVTKRTDANGQETRYFYDGYGRMTQVQHWAWGTVAPNYSTLVLIEQTDQRYDYYYDSNPCNSTFSQNAVGRLAAVGFSLNGSSTGRRYQYSYNTAGRVTKQKMAWTMHGYDEADPNFFMTANYEWDNEGRQTSLTYPVVNDESVGTKETYQFDSMGRLGGMTEYVNGSSSGTTVATATYGAAGEMSGLSYFGLTESRSYNSMFQLTHQSVTNTGGTLMDMTYNFTAGANNGRIASATDGVVGETVNYSYDSLNRLSLAETAGSGGWGQLFTYDGFGNMTAKTATKGTGVPAFSTTINPATNGGPTSYAPAVPDGMDVENRPFGGNGATYGYDQAGKRVLSHVTGGYAWSGTWEYVMYDIGGRRLKTVTCSYSSVPLGGGRIISRRAARWGRGTCILAGSWWCRTTRWWRWIDRGVCGRMGMGRSLRTIRMVRRRRSGRRYRMDARSLGRTWGIQRRRIMRISGTTESERGGLMCRIHIKRAPAQGNQGVGTGTRMFRLIP